VNATRWSAAALVTGLAMAGTMGAAQAARAAPTTKAAPTAKAAPTTGAAASGLARYYHQHVRWHGCQLGPDDTEGQQLDQAGAQCADIRVPLDYAHPARRAITIGISRLKADPSAQRIGAMIINIGGPATPVLGDVLLARQAMGATGARFDLIGMDQRFAGRSTPMDCHWPDNWLPRGAGASRASFREMVRLTRDLARRCGSQERALLPFAGTASAARDMDVIRGALGQRKLSFLGYSYGTYLGALYTQMFPGRSGRIVLDSAIDPAHVGVAKGANGPERQSALREWAVFAAQHNAQYHLGSTARRVLATVRFIYRTAGRHPLHVGPFSVDDTVVPATIIDPLSNDMPSSAAELAANMQALNRAAHGRPANASQPLLDALAQQLTGSGSPLNSARTAIMCADAPVPTNPAVYWRNIQANRASAPLFSPVDQTITPCAFWPFHPAPAPKVANHVPALVVQASGDIDAILSMGQAMHHALAASRMITLQGVRDHSVYLFRGSACVDDAVNAYLNTGTLPATDMSCGATQ